MIITSLGILNVMSRRFLTLAAVFATLHAVASVATLLSCFTRGMVQFDDPTIIESYGDRISCQAADALFQPAMALLSGADFHGALPVVQWIVVLLNSGLWGVVLAAAFVWFTRGSRRGR